MLNAIKKEKTKKHIFIFVQMKYINQLIIWERGQVIVLYHDDLVATPTTYNFIASNTFKNGYWQRVYNNNQ